MSAKTTTEQAEGGISLMMEDTTDHTPARFTAGMYATFFDLMDACREPVEGEPDWTAEVPETTASPEEMPAQAEAPAEGTLAASVARAQARSEAALMEAGAGDGNLPPANVLIYRLIKRGLFADLVTLLFGLGPGEWEEVGIGTIERTLGFFLPRRLVATSVLDATVRASA